MNRQENTPHKEPWYMRLRRKKPLCALLAVFLLYLAIYYWPSLEKGIGHLLGALAPLLLGLCIAYVVNILVCFYERLLFPRCKARLWGRMRRGVCLTLAYLTGAALITAFFWVVIPALSTCIQLLLAELPRAAAALQAWVEELPITTQDFLDVVKRIDLEQIFTKLTKLVTSGIGGTVGWVGGLVSSVARVIVGVIFSAYLLGSKPTLLRQYARLKGHYLPPAAQAKVARAERILNDCFRRYIVGQCTEGLILGLLCMLGMWILGFPYAVMTGVIVGGTALVPIAGSYIGGAVGFLLILTVSPWKALLFLGYLILLQQLEGNLIYPRVVGNSMRLPGIWVFAAVMVGGVLYGILGMMLAVPITAAIYQVLREDIRPDAGAAADAEKTE